VADVRTGALDGAPAEAIYWSHAQVSFTGMSVLVRTAGDPLALAAPVREAVRALDRLVPVSQVRTLDQVVDESLAVRRFQVLLLAVFAGLALSLAALGIYGVLASGVAQRIPELGVRRALGAVARDLVALVGGEASRLLGAGLLLGVAGALALARVMRAALYGVGAADAQVLVGVVVALAAVGALATLAPLRRALAVDPVVTLRGQ
jgi:ABC-type antimicrobial peptide transport system permease subunit